MPEPIQGTEDKQLISSRSYMIELKIRDLDFTNELYRVRITNTVDNPLQNYIVEIFTDPREIMTNKIFGQENLKLSIRLTGQAVEGLPKEVLSTELVHIRTDFEVPMERLSSLDDQRDRAAIPFLAVPRKNIEVMSTLVNKVYTATRVETVLRDLVSQTKVNLDLDTDNINTQLIDQLVVPPLSLTKAIQYINSVFGIYKGTMGWNFEDDTLHIYNLTKRMNKTPAFTVYQLTLAGDNDSIIQECSNGKNFYTYDTLVTGYGANARFAAVAKKINYVVKPRDTLYRVINLDLASVCDDYGLLSKLGTPMYYSSSFNNRTKYHINYTGYDDDTTFAINQVVDPAKDMTSLGLNLERNLPILNLVKVGQVVKLNIGSIDNVDLAGKYILRGTTITFIRAKDREWETTANIQLMRTNRTL